jgi:arsenate reductase (thioredoxin)
MAEAVARREAGDLIEPSSAGLCPLGRLPELTIETLETNNYCIEGLSSKCISREAVQQADLIVNLSGTPIEHIFSPGPSRLSNGQHIEDWDVPDPYGEDPATYQRILEELQQRVLGLANRLRKGHRSAHP